MPTIQQEIGKKNERQRKREQNSRKARQAEEKRAETEEKSAKRAKRRRFFSKQAYSSEKTQKKRKSRILPRNADKQSKMQEKPKKAKICRAFINYAQNKYDRQNRQKRGKDLPYTDEVRQKSAVLYYARNILSKASITLSKRFLCIKRLFFMAI